MDAREAPELWNPESGSEVFDRLVPKGSKLELQIGEHLSRLKKFKRLNEARGRRVPAIQTTEAAAMSSNFNSQHLWSFFSKHYRTSMKRVFVNFRKKSCSRNETRRLLIDPKVLRGDQNSADSGRQNNQKIKCQNLKEGRKLNQIKLEMIKLKKNRT